MHICRHIVSIIKGYSMTARLFCHHCGKHYEVDIEAIKLFQQYHSTQLTFERNTYYCESGCFFKILNTIKLKQEAS